MENYKAILTAQKEALTKDIDGMSEQIKTYETMLSGMKERKSLAVKELKAIEKKMAKIDNPA